MEVFTPMNGRVSNLIEPKSCVPDFRAFPVTNEEYEPSKWLTIGLSGCK